MREWIALVAPVALAACASVPPPAATASVESEARAFMAGYAADLRAHDSEAIAARYDPEGAHMIFDGMREFVSAANLRKSYKEGWVGPTTFEWRDLSYEVAGPDAVVVVGGFDWGDGKRIRKMSYTGLLRRRDGQWRIRLENEGPIREMKPAG